jgi:hypothetical protein
MVSDIPAVDGKIVNFFIQFSTAKCPGIGCRFLPYPDILHVVYTAYSEGFKEVFETFYIA